MRDYLKINKIVKSNNKITYLYECTGKWEKTLNLDDKFNVEYEFSIEDVPDSIAIIPFICNILPISWVYDIDIIVEELDEKFYNNLSKIKEGYQNMYPSINMLGNISVKKISNNKLISKGSCMFFSGGVDAFNTLLNHYDEKPALITVWGSDVSLNNLSAWDKVNSHIKKVSTEFGLNHFVIKSNFRTFLNYKELTSHVHKLINAEWWHDFQHGIGLIGLSAPLVYINKFEHIYIASSFTISEKGKITCASDPTIDNNLKFSNCKTVHDGYEFSRQDKIKNIINWCDKFKKKVLLRVCWKSSLGYNCCSCEKCYRTMLGIIAEKKDPNDFGFDLTYLKRKRMMKELKTIVKYDALRYTYIKNAFIKNYSLDETPDDLIWLRHIELKNKKPFYVKVYEKIRILNKKIYNKLFKKRG